MTNLLTNASFEGGWDDVVLQGRPKTQQPRGYALHAQAVGQPLLSAGAFAGIDHDPVVETARTVPEIVHKPAVLLPPEQGPGGSDALILYLQGVIDAEKLASALVALATAVIVAIAAEDSAEKIGGTYIEGWPTCEVCGDPAEAVTADGWYCEEHAPSGALPVVIQ